MSKIVFAGFMAAWFLAASPIKRSSSVKETKEGVVKLPCSLATVEEAISYRDSLQIADERQDVAVLNLLISTLAPS